MRLPIPQRFRDRRRSRGQSLVEFALIFPVFLLLVAMAVDAGRLFYTYVAVSNAAKEGAAYGAINPVCTDASVAAGTLCPNPSNVTWRVTNEAPNLPVTPTAIQCLAPNGSPRSPMTTCVPEDTYVVHVEADFDLLTPILGQMFGGTLKLGTEARAQVLNLAFDPTPGVAVTKTACFGVACTPVTTPFFDGADNIYQEGMSGDVVTYRVAIQNAGGARLTNMTINDSAGALPTGTATCPDSFPATMNVGASWACEYTRTAPNTGGPPEILYGNTVTINATELDAPRLATATVRVIATPANLVLRKHINVYLAGGAGNGPSFGSETSITAYLNTQVSSVVLWYRLTVLNDGGQDALEFSLTDTSGAIPVTAECPALPATLGPGQQYTCRFSRTYLGPGASTNIETATAQAENVDPVAEQTTATIQVCTDPQLVIPKLVGRSKTQAENDWTSAGFALVQLTSWPGQPNAIVRTQSIQAYSCGPSTQSMTVTE